MNGVRDGPQEQRKTGPDAAPPFFKDVDFMIGDTRHLYLYKIEGELRALEALLETLRRDVERSHGPDRVEHERELDGARGRRNRAKARLEDVRLAPEGTWRMSRVNADAAVSAFRSALADLAERYGRRAA